MSDFNVLDIINDETIRTYEKKEEKIYYKNILKNEKNDFPIIEIEELANSLINFGLQQNLVVYKEDNNYKLLSGERRLTAIEYIFKNNIELSEERKKELEYPLCRIEKGIKDKDLLELLIFETNIQSRANGDWNKLGIVKKYLDLLNVCENKKLIKTEKGQIKTLLSKKFNISERTAVKYNVILNKENDEILESIKNGELSINGAYKKVQKENNKPTDNTWEDLESELCKKLNTKVSFKKKSFVIHFENVEELNRLLEIMNLE